MIVSSDTKTIIFLSFLALFSLISSKSFMKLGALTNAGLNEIISEQVTQAFCFVNSNGTVYDINPLHNSTADYVIKDPNSEIDFNICENAITKCRNTSYLAVYNSLEKGAISGCISLAGAATVMSKWSLINDTEKNVSSLKVELPQGDVCKTDATKNYTTTLVLTCDESAASPKIVNSNDVNINKCANTIQIVSKYGCPKFNIYSFWTAIMTNKFIIGPILMVVGALLLIFGQKWILFIEIVTGTLVVSFVLIFLLFGNLTIEYNTLSFWLIIALCIAIGLIAGYGLYRLRNIFPKVASMLVGGFLGYLLGVFLYNLALKYINSNPLVIYWVTIICSIALLVILAFFLTDHIFILATAFVGAYLFIRGISYMAGKFPDERQVIDLISRNEYDQAKKLLTWEVYVYLVGWVILGIIGMVIQYKWLTKDSDEKKEHEHKDEASKPLINK